MSKLKITAEDMLAGANARYEIEVPPEVMRPGTSGSADQKQFCVSLKPLTIGTFQLILKASRDDSSLIPLLMIKESLVEPVMTLEQIKKLHIGLITFLIENIRNISGLNEKKKGIKARSSLLAKVYYRLARTFGWTPDVVQQLTMAQANVYLELLDWEKGHAEVS